MIDGAGASAKGGTGDLARRAVSGFVLAAGALLLTWTGGLPFALLWLAAGIVVVLEWLAMSGAEPRGLLRLVAAAGLAALFAAVLLDGSPVLAAALVGASAAAVALAARPGRRAWSAAGLVYAALVVAVPVAARAREGSGLALTLWMFAVVWTTDVAAYFAGRSIGGPRLWPRVSPKKTWSGFAGGVVAASFAGLVVARIAASRGVAVPWGTVAVLAGSALAAAASQGGDLAESAMKRHFGVKDSGALIPGHGGVMDRLDGFVAVLLLVGLALLGARFAET